jgi:hypothetical protein
LQTHSVNVQTYKFPAEPIGKICAPQTDPTYDASGSDNKIKERLALISLNEFTELVIHLNVGIDSRCTKYSAKTIRLRKSVQ